MIVFKNKNLFFTFL